MYLYHWISCVYIILRYNKEVKSHLDLKNYIYRPSFISKLVLINLIHYRFVFLYAPLVACIFNSPLLFALTSTLNNLNYWCIARNHDQFLHLHFVWILNISDFDLRLRCMVFAVAINYFSPGLSKIRHGGIKWVYPKTFKLFLRTFNGFIPTTWIAKYDSLCSLMALGGLAIELICAPLMLVNINYVPYVVPLLLVFHIGIDLTLNMEFYLNSMGLLFLMQQYYLSNDLSNDLSNYSSLIQLTLALLYSLTMRDNWPFNSIEIFAFNYEQCVTIKNRQAHYYIEVKRNHILHKHYFILEYFFEVYTSLDSEFYDLFPEFGKGRFAKVSYGALLNLNDKATEKEFDLLLEKDIKVITILDKEYPKFIIERFDNAPPPMLFCKGKMFRENLKFINRRKSSASNIL